MKHKKNIIAIIQARLGSTRLPYKMMLSLHGRPIIGWVVTRVKKSKLLDGVVVSIPDTEENDILADYLNRLHIDIFRGSENDVLHRVYHTALESNASDVVRICGDNPLISGSEIDNLISFFNRNRCDYAYNHIPVSNTYPDGLGAEILPFDLLEHIEEVATRRKHREHCLSYIWDHQNEFVIKTFDPINKSIQQPDLKLDIDTFDDYRNLALNDISVDSTAEEIVSILGR